MRVVLPAPLGPNTASLSPFDKLRFMFSRALNPSGYSKLKLFTLGNNHLYLIKSF